MVANLPKDAANKNITDPPSSKLVFVPSRRISRRVRLKHILKMFHENTILLRIVKFPQNLEKLCLLFLLVWFVAR